MKKLLCMLLTFVFIFSMIPTFGEDVTFADLNGHWARNYVLPLARDGIISGKAPNVFDPDAQITRAEFVTLVSKLCNLRPDEASPYADVAEGAWFASSISAAKAYGALDENLTLDGNFYPDQPITREEMTSIIIRMAEEIRGALLNKKEGFTDAAFFAPWTAEYIAKAAGEGIVTGNPDGSFNAKGNATRAEAAVIIKRFRDLLNKAPRRLEAGEYHPVYDGIIYEVDLQAMIEEAYAKGEQSISLEKGAYRITAGSLEHLTLTDMKDFTIEGNGSTFLLQDLTKVGIRLLRCENVRIANVNVEYEKLPFFQARILNLDREEKIVDLYIPVGYRDYFEDTAGLTNQIDLEFHEAETGDYIHTVASHTLNFSNLTKIGDRTYRLLSAKITSDNRLNAGDYLAGGERYAVATAVSVESSKQCQFRHVSVWGGRCGIMMSGGYGDHRLDGVRVEPGPRPLGATEDRVYSTVADASGCLWNEVGCTITNSVFRNCGDDGINIRGNWMRVAELISEKELIFAASSDNATVKAGDRVRFYTPDFGAVGEASVTKVETVTDYQYPEALKSDFDVSSFEPRRYFRIQLSSAVKGVEVGGWVSNLNANSNGFSVTNTYYGNIRPRGMVVQGSDGVIEGCTFYNTGSAGVLLMADIQWMAADMLRNVVVRNNVFDTCGMRPDFPSLELSGYYDGKNEDITIEGNIIRNSPHSAISLSHTKNLVVRNNVIERPQASAERFPAIDVDKVENAEIYGNTFPQGWTEIEVTTDTKNVVVK